MKALLLTLGLVGCSTSPTSPSGLDIYKYWPEAVTRLDCYLSNHDECEPDYVRPFVTVVNGTPETCVYNPNTDTVIVNPYYAHGCAAHELGHAALEQAGNKCWKDFEHERGVEICD